MLLNPVDVVDAIDPASFRKKYYDTMKPVVIKNMSKDWPASTKWDWDYFKSKVGSVNVGVYNNIKSDSRTPVNKADGYMLFGDYLDKVKQGPVELRIFLFNLFLHAPELVQDFSWPDELMTGFVKRFPMLFVGGAGSVTHMHFDIDMSHILHTQFMGRKRVLLFPFEEQHNLYRKPWEVLSFVNFEKYYDPVNSKLDIEQFPALQKARGYDIILEHGDTLFMPAGYWHHMEYIDSGFAMSLRALQNSMTGKLKGAWNLFGMRNIDTLMKRTAPEWWYNFKKSRTFDTANQ
ncbi:cupin-like domain-containing protein [Flavihumibacter fluvii]|uniref:cupin-like domain-containing protein n=1 Tax=Flavihumibacter fluvii TaxID=2838157 RepID=UPI001BDE2164|nr:cupin-like domain-containing protein [Flavihumibacter fluvii]ULQ51546.1 cupin-like domain-containing protein [Flavihumibacter fluvii]